MSEFRLLRIKVPPTLRINVITPKCLGDSPVVKIINPKNVAQPTNVTRDAHCQYTVVCDASSVGETVDLSLSAGRFAFLSIFRIFTLAFWSGFLPGRGFWTSFPLKRFLLRTVILSLALYVVLVGLELFKIEVHKPFAKFLNTLRMAELSGDKIKEVIGFDKPDPFFSSTEAFNFLNRTGKELQDVYLMTYVVQNNKAYRLLVRKEFLAADDLDAAANICMKEINADIPSAEYYRLFMEHEALSSDLTFAFAEWTSDARGIISDDYQLFLLSENIRNWQSNIQQIKNSSGAALDTLAETFNLRRDSVDNMDDEDFREAVIIAFNLAVRLPADTDIEYDEGVPSFYLDADDEANFRCVRKLPVAATK